MELLEGELECDCFFAERLSREGINTDVQETIISAAASNTFSYIRGALFSISATTSYIQGIKKDRIFRKEYNYMITIIIYFFIYIFQITLHPGDRQFVTIVNTEPRLLFVLEAFNLLDS